MNLVRLFLSLALWPGIFATTVFLHRLILGAWANPNFPWMGSASFGVGILLAWAAFIFLPRPRGFYVLGHELTHALAVWCSGGRVHSLHVGDQGGKVVADRVSPWISLAPYIFPFYPLGAGILWLAGTRCWPEANHYAIPFLGIWGAIWGYHYAFTLSLIPTRQPDFLVYGRIFSFTLIALGNLLVAALLTWSTFRPSPAGQSLIFLGSEWAWTYTQIVYWLSGLLLRYLPHPA